MHFINTNHLSRGLGVLRPHSSQAQTAASSHRNPRPSLAVRVMGQLLLLVLSLMPVGQTQAATEYVKTSRWSFSYTNDGMEGIVLRNVWYTSPSGQSAKVAQWLALEFFRVRYQDDAAGPYSDNFKLNSSKLYISCPTDYGTLPENLCSLPPGGCESNPNYFGCTDSTTWNAPTGGVSVCQQSNTSGAVRLVAQGGANCGNYRFVETFELKDDGTISLYLQAKGIQATNDDGTSREHMHYAYFRLDLDADGSNNIVSMDGFKQTREAATDLGGLRHTMSDGSLRSYVFEVKNPTSQKAVWAWAGKSDVRDHTAIHGDDTWTGWSRFDAWYHTYHSEEQVGYKATTDYGPPYGACGGDEPVNYDQAPGPRMVNREDVLNTVAETTLVRSGSTVTQQPGAESIDNTNSLLWVNVPLYHDADPSATTHGCHDAQLLLRPSWGGCHPNQGLSCGTSTGKIQCDGTCK